MNVEQMNEYVMELEKICSGNDSISPRLFEEYGVKISGYATKTKGEYIAESYAAFCNGKAELIDPKLKDIFENIRKTGRN